MIPWQIKILAKLILSRIPMDYFFWQKLELFKHGAMEQPAYAFNTFKNHYDRASFARKSSAFTTLELGPGDSLFSALIAHAFGAQASYLIDAGAYAKEDLDLYRSMSHYLSSKGLSAPDLSSMRSIQDVMSACNATYGPEGINSLRLIPDGSVDFVWSQAVLEHIKRDQFPDFIRESRRIIRNDGICSHRIDLQDHLGGALNNLRFQSELWESGFMSGSGFYTNRLRYPEMLKCFEDAGFSAQVLQVNRWEKLPTPRKHLSREFQDFSDDELCISGFDIILKPR